MAKFIVLGKYTSQGIGKIKDAPSRIDAARKAAKDAGGDFKEFYLTMGQYDFVTIMELPNDDAAAKFALATGSLGNVSTETLRAFDEAEFRNLVKQLG